MTTVITEVWILRAVPVLHNPLHQHVHPLAWLLCEPRAPVVKHLQVQHLPEVIAPDFFMQVFRQASPRLAALTLDPNTAVLELFVGARLLHDLRASLVLQADL